MNSNLILIQMLIVICLILILYFMGRLGRLSIFPKIPSYFYLLSLFIALSSSLFIDISLGLAIAIIIIIIFILFDERLFRVLYGDSEAQELIDFERNQCSNPNCTSTLFRPLESPIHNQDELVNAVCVNCNALVFVVIEPIVDVDGNLLTEEVSDYVDAGDSDILGLDNVRVNINLGTEDSDADILPTEITDGPEEERVNFETLQALFGDDEPTEVTGVRIIDEANDFIPDRKNKWYPRNALKKGMFGVNTNKITDAVGLYDTNKFELTAIKFIPEFEKVRKRYAIVKIVGLFNLDAEAHAFDKTWFYNYYKEHYHLEIADFDYVIRLELTSRSSNWTNISSFPVSVFQEYFFTPIQKTITKIAEERRFCKGCKQELQIINRIYCNQCYRMSRTIVDEEEKGE